MLIQTSKCMGCGKGGEIDVPEDGYVRWKNGEFIQNALPMLTANQREQLMTGMHGECFDDMFPEEEEEEEDF